MSKVGIKGHVTEVGWAAPKTGTSYECHASIKILIGRPRSQEKAEEKLNKLREKLLGKDITIFLLE
ncbi:unnamed protein product [marine sediment metagenome]|uniref:Uncharacterized protein n=1 Tax=marine sediment metagenome TaxID=412755 RepID=X1MV00_9ZZZZ